MEEKQQLNIQEDTLESTPIPMIQQNHDEFDQKAHSQNIEEKNSPELLTSSESFLKPQSTMQIACDYVKTITTIASYSIIISGPNFFLMQQFTTFKHGLRAIAYVFGLDTLILEPITTLLTPAANLIAEAYGRSTSNSITEIEVNESKKNIGVIFRQLKLLALISSLPSIPILLLFKPILSNLGQPKDAIDLAQKVFNVLWIGMIPQQFLRANFQLLSGLKKSKLMLKVLVGYSCLQTGLAYILMKKTDLGPAGYAYSFVTSSLLINVGLELYLKFSSKFKDYELFRENRCCSQLYDPKIFKQLLKLGWPVAVKTAFEELGLFTSSLLSAGISPSASEAFQAVRIYTLPLTSYEIYASSMHSSIMSYVKGQEKADEEKKGRHGNKKMKITHKFGLAYGVGFGCTFLVVLFCLYKPLSAIFISDAKVVEFTKYLYLIQGINLALDGGRNMQIGTLRALDDTKTPMYWNAFSFVIIGIGGWLLGFKTKLGVYGVTLARTTGIGIAMCALTQRTIHKFKQLSKFGFSFFDQNTSEEKERDDNANEANIESYHEPLLQ